VTEIALSFSDAALDELARRLVPRVVEALRAEGGFGDEPEFLTVAEAAELMRCSKGHVHNLVSAGVLSYAARNGSRGLLARRELRAYLGCVETLSPGQQAQRKRKAA
jgi:excisionase family DNA binding protein